MADSSDRVAALKKKMQEAAAKRAQEQAAAAGAAAPAAPEAPVPAVSVESSTENGSAAEAPAASSQAEAVAVIDAAGTAPEGDESTSGVQPVADALAQAETADGAAASADADGDGRVGRGEDVGVPAGPAVAGVADANESTVGPADQGAVAATAAAAGVAGDPELPRELSPEEIEKREMSRRELLTYAWGGALALVGGAVGFGLFEFMYPRFRAGEFGGQFFVPSSELPTSDAEPVAFSAGKFWLVQSETEGPKALYMVCTHLGCLYKWEASNFRFECPCHGSKFSKDGFFIEGPAPRSLDTFATTVEGDTIVVDTGSKTIGAPALDSPDRVAA